MSAQPRLNDNRISALQLTACLMVVALHVSARTFAQWDGGWWIANFYNSFTRSCVPLFIMIAGMTLLRKDEPLGAFFSKRMLRILPPLLLWSFFYLWWLDYNGVETGNWIAAILRGPTMYHLWYFYALVGLYLIVPVLRKFFLHSKRSEHLWFLGACLVIGSLVPTIQNAMFDPRCEGGVYFAGLQPYHLTYFSGYIGYLLLGAYLANNLPGKRISGAVFVISSLAIAGLTGWQSIAYNAPCQFYYVYTTPLVAAAAFGLFGFFLNLTTDTGIRYGDALPSFASCTLGVYGLHVFMIDFVGSRMGVTLDMAHPAVSIPIVTAAVFAFSLSIIFVLRLFPPLRTIF